MADGRPPTTEDEQRLVSLDPEDLEHLRRLLMKLNPNGSVSRVVSGAPHAPESLLQHARRLLSDRRKRVEIFGAQMFAEPAWEMILTLYCDEGGRRHTQTSLCELSGASRSTGMRWIDYLVDRRLVTREDHPTDKRRNFVSLTAEARQHLELYLSETA